MIEKGMMIHMRSLTGLVSISFRSLTVESIAERMTESGLKTVEWGADVHCVPGDTARANEVKTVSDRYGLTVGAYGSYYRVGTQAENTPRFEDIVQTASILGAPIIRVWAFNKGSADVSDEEYARVLTDMRRICALAAEKKLLVSLECHNGTLTDDYRSALRLLSDANADNLTMYWQPNQFRTDEYNKEAAAALKDCVTNVHVFNWKGTKKLPLAEAIPLWREYRRILDGGRYAHAYLLEFMPCDTPEELKTEADALQRIMG